jgi:hypothetical protein
MQKRVYVFMYSVQHFDLILTKIIMLQQMLTELPNIEFNKIMFSGSWVALREHLDGAILTGTPLDCEMCLKIVMMNFTYKNQSKKLAKQHNHNPDG